MVDKEGLVDINKQIELFKMIGNTLKGKTEALVIGGSAMLFYGLKKITKDIDLVFMSEGDFDDVEDVLRRSGYGEKSGIKIFKHYEVIKKKPVMLEDKGVRFDLFLKDVICFEMTESILSRIREVHEFGNLVVRVVSPEDIILLKCATERKRDRDDAKEIIEKVGVDWNLIIQEVVNQTRKKGYIFSVFLYDFLMDLKEDLKVDVPKEVIKKVRTIGEREMVKRLGK